MKIDKNQWKWTRKPANFSIEEDSIEITTARTQTFGREPTTTSAMTMHPCCKSNLLNRFSPSWSKRNLKASAVLINVVSLCIWTAKIG